MAGLALLANAGGGAMPGRARVMGVVFVHEAWIVGEFVSNRYAVMEVCLVMHWNGSMKRCYSGAF